MGKAEAFTQRNVMQVGYWVVGYFIVLTLALFIAKRLPVDPRISTSILTLLLTIFMLHSYGSDRALIFLFANYLCGIQFYRWGQLYPVMAMLCLTSYVLSNGRPARFGLWALFLGLWLVGVVVSAAHSYFTLSADLMTQWVGVQEYIGCVSSFILAYRVTSEKRGENDALVALGWVGVIVGVLAWLTVFHPLVAGYFIPGVGAVKYGTPGQTPFGHMPKLAIEITGVSLAAFLNCAVGLSLLGARPVKFLVGFLMVVAGAVTALLLYRRSMVSGSVLAIAFVLVHNFGRSRKILVAFLALALIFFGLVAFGFFWELFGPTYWMPSKLATTLPEEVTRDRADIWEEAWADIQSSPWLGLGPRFYSGETGDETLDFGGANVHNAFLYYVRALGIPIGILCSAVLLVLSVRAVTAPFFRRLREHEVFALSVLGAFSSALLFYAAFGDIQRMANPHVLVWALLGICAALERRRKWERRTPVP